MIKLRYILDGDRDELRAIREELSALRTMDKTRPQQAEPSITTSSAPQYGPSVGGKIPSLHQIALSGQSEIDRLKTLRADLLNSGLYDPADTVIQEVDKTIFQHQNLLTKKIDTGAIEQKN